MTPRGASEAELSDRIRLLHVTTPQGYAGALVKDGQHVFTYDLSTYQPVEKPASAISLTMPPRAASWKSTNLLPAFQTFLPEGFLRDHIREKFGKTLRMDDMALLALSGANSIGRVRVSIDMPGHEKSNLKGESLAEILADQGTRDLFEYLCDKYLVSTSIAGVQPKVVVPVEAPEAPGGASEKSSIGERSSLRGRELIIKVDGPDYPGISENEYHCLSIAKSCPGLFEVPAFHLSADLRRLAIERFDISENGTYLGFEDMVALQGRVNDEKYTGSYESVALAIRNNCSPTLQADSLRRYFASVVLAVAVRNGDAHLKNFGLLYSDPGTEDCRLSPIFDQVCTTAYIPKDMLALKLSKSKAWPSRAQLEKFGKSSCDVSNPGEVIDEVSEAVAGYRPDIQGPAWGMLRDIFDLGAAALATEKSWPRER